MQQPPGGYGPPPTDYGQPPPGPFQCRACSYAGHAMVTTKVSTGGWILMVVVLCLFFPLFWVPLVSLKDCVTQCPNCRAPA
jgi:hypothetical protein